jgi:hypothetical protein
MVSYGHDMDAGVFGQTYFMPFELPAQSQ